MNTQPLSEVQLEMSSYANIALNETHLLTEWGFEQLELYTPGSTPISRPER